MKNENISRYTLEELAKLPDETDWTRVMATTPEEALAQSLSDPDEAGMAIDWASATVVMPQPKAAIHMRIDRDVLDHFRKTGRGYQTRINAVLAAYVRETERKAGR